MNLVSQRALGIILTSFHHPILVGFGNYLISTSYSGRNFGRNTSCMISLISVPLTSIWHTMTTGIMLPAGGQNVKHQRKYLSDSPTCVYFLNFNRWLWVPYQVHCNIIMDAIPLYFRHISMSSPNFWSTNITQKYSTYSLQERMTNSPAVVLRSKCSCTLFIKCPLYFYRLLSPKIKNDINFCLRNLTFFLNTSSRFTGPNTL